MRRDFATVAKGAALLLYAGGCYVLSPELVWRIDLDTFGAAPADAEAPRPMETAAGPRIATAARSRSSARRCSRTSRTPSGTCTSTASSSPCQLAREPPAHRPLPESAHRLLMRCFAGQQQSRLVAREYHRCHEALGRELGPRPAGETGRLYRELTRGAGPS